MKILVVIRVIIGFLSLALAVVGVVLPILPTTPFVILSLAMFSSTPRIRNKILKIPFVKEYYSCYMEHKPIKRSTIITSIIFLWAGLILSMVLVKLWYVIMILATVGTIVTLHILWIARAKRTRAIVPKDKCIGGADEQSS